VSFALLAEDENLRRHGNSGCLVADLTHQENSKRKIQGGKTWL
jgi:hypothetical protein